MSRLESTLFIAVFVSVGVNMARLFVEGAAGWTLPENLRFVLDVVFGLGFSTILTGCQYLVTTSVVTEGMGLLHRFAQRRENMWLALPEFASMMAATATWPLLLGASCLLGSAHLAMVFGGERHVSAVLAGSFFSRVPFAWPLAAIVIMGIEVAAVALAIIAAKRNFQERIDLNTEEKTDQLLIERNGAIDALREKTESNPEPTVEPTTQCSVSACCEKCGWNSVHPTQKSANYSLGSHKRWCSAED